MLDTASYADLRAATMKVSVSQRQLFAVLPIPNPLLSPLQERHGARDEAAEDADWRAASNSTRLLPPGCFARRPIKSAGCASAVWQRYRPALRHQRRPELGA